MIRNLPVFSFLLFALLGTAPVLAAFTDNLDGTVSDSVTGLMWGKCAWGQSNDTDCSGGAASTHTWAQALGVAVTANAASYKTYSDWRLPNRSELESLVKIDASSPAIDATAFPNTPSNNFWSSTPYAPGPTGAWKVSFNDGSFGTVNKPNTYYVRLVRSGQSFGSFDSQADITPPAYQSAALSAGNTVATLTFNETLVNNLADLPTLKAAITFAADGSTFTALAGGDAVALSGSTLTVTFASALTGATNKLKIAANSLKDAAGNVLASAVTTAAIAANDITPPAYQSASLNAGLTVATLTFDEAPVNNLADLPTLKAAITFAADGATFTALAGGDAVALSGSTLTVTFAGALTGSTNKLKIAANSLKDAAGNVLASAVTTAALVAADTTPDAFSFTAQTGAALSTATESAAITVAGINAAANVSISGGQYAVSTDSGGSWGAYTAAAGTVSLNDQVKVKLTSSGSYSTAVTATLTIGGVNGVFSVTTQAAPVPASSGGDYTPPPNTNLIPTGGGTATLTNGQSVTVSDNGKDGTSISLPPPPTTPTTTGTPGNSVNITLPGTGTVGVSSNSADTQLGVTHVTLPGTTTSVSTVTVDQGSASFTATQAGQAVAGLKNGIVVVSGTKDSQVTVDTTGPNAKIGVQSSDTIIVPTGSANVNGTSVDLPSPTASGGQASTVNVNVGGQALTIQASQPNTTMTFKVVDIDGVQTPVLAVTGTAQVTTTGEDKPIVSVNGNVIKSGKSGGGSSQKCDTVVQASSNSSSDMVHVVTCYIVLDVGSFTALNGGAKNSFAAIKDGIVWAGETAEFDKDGKVISAYVGTRDGTTAAVGDDVVPGGNKFSAAGYRNNAFIPRLSGTPLRLNGAKLDETLFSVINKTLGVTVQPALPTQSDQGVLNFTFAGNLAAQGVQNTQVNYTINADTASVFPTRRIRVDTSRPDGISISPEGDVQVATGGLVTTFAPSLADPKGFADKVAQALPGSTAALRWNGTWNVTAADGRTYVGRPQWSFWKAAPDAETFTTLADGSIFYSNQGFGQPIFPDFYDYDTLQATFRTDLKDPALTVMPRMDGTATATVNGQTYTLYPQWNLIKPAAGKPAWWIENNVVYIKNADGSAQGFTVK